MDMEQAEQLVMKAWPAIVAECCAMLGGELHYQAVVYHCLRNAGVPAAQLGMNVKQWIENPVSELFRSWDLRKQENFQGGFEPIPDIVLFSDAIRGDWRRRNRVNTLRHMLMAIEVKASERQGGRLSQAEIVRDLRKLAAHREEVRHLGNDMKPVMMVIDVAPEINERMRPETVSACAKLAAESGVLWLYASVMQEDSVSA